nr:hypothetical protein [Frondihabitans sp. 762G35]
MDPQTDQLTGRQQWVFDIQASHPIKLSKLLGQAGVEVGGRTISPGPPQLGAARRFSDNQPTKNGNTRITGRSDHRMEQPVLIGELPKDGLFTDSGISGHRLHRRAHPVTCRRTQQLPGQTLSLRFPRGSDHGREGLTFTDSPTPPNHNM